MYYIYIRISTIIYNKYDDMLICLMGPILFYINKVITFRLKIQSFIY